MCHEGTSGFRPLVQPYTWFHRVISVFSNSIHAQQVAHGRGWGGGTDDLSAPEKLIRLGNRFRMEAWVGGSWYAWFRHLDICSWESSDHHVSLSARVFLCDAPQGSIAAHLLLPANMLKTGHAIHSKQYVLTTVTPMTSHSNFIVRQERTVQPNPRFRLMATLLQISRSAISVWGMFRSGTLCVYNT